MAALNSNLEVFTISADLSAIKRIYQCIQQVEDLDLKIDSLINNVDYGAGGLVNGHPLDTVERAVVTNAMAPTLITQAFYLSLLKSRECTLYWRRSSDSSSA